ncbi:MAG: T9SS type A sorting domain-containing protein [bacterium]
MRIPNYFFLAYFFTFMLLNPFSLFAQQPAWELVRKDFWGKIAIDPTNPDIIYVSPGTAPGYGMYKSPDGGKTWVQYLTGYEGLGAAGIVIDPQNPQRLWVYGGAFRGIVRSENGGMTAVRADTGIVVDHHGYSVSAMAYDSKRDILYAGDTAIGGGIYRSFDGGRRWQQIQAYGQGLIFSPLFFWLEEDSIWVYSGPGVSSGIWRSKDFGMTWTPLHPEILAEQTISFLVKAPKSQTLYAAGLSGNIYKSYDLGEHWSFVSDATSGSDVLAGGFAVSYLDTNYVYSGGSPGAFPSGKGGFYLSRDSGKGWQFYHAGLPQDVYRVWSLAQTQNSLYISVFVNDPSKNGIYRLSQALLTPVQEHPSSSLPPKFSLLQNYPNPFNAQTKIEFAVTKKETIALDVYNLSGEHVVSLLNGLRDIGRYSVVWNGKNSKGGDMASGIYLYRLRAGGEILIRKLLLIR